MGEQTTKTMSNEQLIGACVELDREQKRSRVLMKQLQGGASGKGLGSHGRPQCEVCEVLR